MLSMSTTFIVVTIIACLTITVKLHTTYILVFFRFFLALELLFSGFYAYLFTANSVAMEVIILPIILNC